SRRPLVRTDAADMLKRRLKQAGLPAHYSPHSFRATGITNFLENDGTFIFKPKLGSLIEPRMAGRGLELDGGPNRGPWKIGIATTIFWIGERPIANNPVPNDRSSWDPNWFSNYGGYDDPNSKSRKDFIPMSFLPRQRSPPSFEGRPDSGGRREHE